jgi:hypothetical protein
MSGSIWSVPRYDVVTMNWGTEESDCEPGKHVKVEPPFTTEAMYTCRQFVVVQAHFGRHAGKTVNSRCTFLMTRACVPEHDEYDAYDEYDEFDQFDEYDEHVD